MHLARTGGSSQTHWPWESPARLALRALTRGWLPSAQKPHTSTFLSPFAPRPLRRFSARMRTLTPRQVSPLSRSPRFTSHVTQNHSASKHPTPPHRRFHTLPLSSMGFPSRGPGFTIGLQVRRERQAESSSSACGLIPHLRLLSTPPRGDAVTFGFQAGERMPGEDLHLYTCALTGAQARLSEPPRAEGGLSTADRKASGTIRFLPAGQLRRKLSTIDRRRGGGAQGSSRPEREQGGSSHGDDVVREAGSQRGS